MGSSAKRFLSVAVLGVLCACGGLQPQGISQHTSESERQAHLASPKFQKGVIYDCLFNLVTKDKKAESLRQYIYDEDGTTDVLYCTPTFTHGLACFDRTLRAGVEVFEIPTYKTIEIASDGSASMQEYDITYAPYDGINQKVVKTRTTQYTGSCSRGPAYPDGVSVPQPLVQ